MAECPCLKDKERLEDMTDIAMSMAKATNIISAMKGICPQGQIYILKMACIAVLMEDDKLEQLATELRAVRLSARMGMVN